MMFQMTFAIITPALIAGAFADRMKFSAMCSSWRCGRCWSTRRSRTGCGRRPAGARSIGALDFAGGTVVHINAGIAGLVSALVLGKRVGYGTENMAPYNLAYAVIGASLLWVGWFGFNAGSAVGAERPRRHGDGGDADRHRRRGARPGCSPSGSPRASPPCSALRLRRGRRPGGDHPGLGLRAAGRRRSSSASPPAWSASGRATSLKHMLGYDDSLDAFGVHGIGGIIGALLTGVFAFGPLSATDATPDGSPGGLAQLWIQCEGVAATLLYSGIGTLILLYITKALVGLRVNEEEEREGLDLVLHGEQVF